jgi:hypothetical protein
LLMANVIERNIETLNVWWVEVDDSISS